MVLEYRYRHRDQNLDGKCVWITACAAAHHVDCVESLISICEFISSCRRHIFGRRDVKHHLAREKSGVLRACVGRKRRRIHFAARNKISGGGRRELIFARRHDETMKWNCPFWISLRAVATTERIMCVSVYKTRESEWQKRLNKRDEATAFAIWMRRRRLAVGAKRNEAF